MLKTGLALLVGIALAACGGSSQAAPATNFAALMSSANEVPTNTSTATGTFTAMLTGTTLNYTVTWTGLTGNATAAHIHVGSPSVAGGVVGPFAGFPAAKAGTFSGTITSVTPSGVVTNFDDLLVQMRGGNTYANIHTSGSPGGEIRGQIAPQ